MSVVRAVKLIGEAAANRADPSERWQSLITLFARDFLLGGLDVH
jgi:hypothetical protein